MFFYNKKNGRPLIKRIRTFLNEPERIDPIRQIPKNRPKKLPRKTGNNFPFAALSASSACFHFRRFLQASGMPAVPGPAMRAHHDSLRSHLLPHLSRPGASTVQACLSPVQGKLPHRCQIGRADGFTRKLGSNGVWEGV